MSAAVDAGRARSRIPHDRRRWSERLDRTLTTLEGLERYEGHFLNWYDTATLAPLHPRYVSTVDSGNLAGALIALAQGLERSSSDAADAGAQLLAGLADTADLLARPRRRARGDRATATAVTRVNRLGARDRCGRRGASSTAADGCDRARRARRSELAAAAGVEAARRRSSRQATSRSGAARVVERDRGAGRRAGRPCRRAATRWLAARARRSPTRCGSSSSTTGGGGSSRSATGSPTPTVRGGSTRSFYDLLASEARLASFVAIAKGDVPQHHWFHLGRLVTNVDGRATLMSWGGTMFEYLMPQLLMRSFPGTLLDQSCRASVRRQIEYGSERGVPWGISESAYAFTDRAGNYQYKRVRRAGPRARSAASPTTRRSRRTPPRWRASSIPAAAATNLERLARDGARRAASGSTSRSTTGRAQPRRRDAAGGRRTAGDRARVLRPPPGHVARRAGQRRAATTCSSARFHADPRVQATELLLQERVPREAILVGAAPGRERRRGAVAAGARLAAVPIAAHRRARTRTSCRTAATPRR